MFPGLGFVGEDADSAIGVEAVSDARPGGHAHAQALAANRHAPVGADFASGPQNPEVWPPGATRERAQHAAWFALGGPHGGVERALKFALDFVGVAVTAPVGQKCVGSFGSGAIFGGAEGGQAPCQYWCWRSILPLAWGMRA
jgi:hypothetical protein